MFGSHLSIAGGLHHALLQSERLGLDTVQVFTKNQQQWRVPKLNRPAVDLWRQHARRLSFKATVSHASYLINLASPDPVLWRRSVGLLVEEMRRCQSLGIGYLVIHPGCHMGSGEEAGIARVAQALDRARGRCAADRVTICLEGTAGQGTSVGHRLEHLARIRECVESRRSVAFCLDTAHLFAAGYDFRGRRYGRFMREVQRLLGLGRIKVWHLNDTKRPLGSRVDRHAHIGQGHIGLAGFRAIVRDAVFAAVPKILETPKEKDEQGRDWDQVNLAALRGLMA
jgi:deoxyribonuclease-4